QMLHSLICHLLAIHPEHRESLEAGYLLQPGICYLVIQVQFVEFLEAHQTLESHPCHLRLLQIEFDQVCQAGEFLQPCIRHGRVSQVKRVDFLLQPWAGLSICSPCLREGVQQAQLSKHTQVV